MKYRVIIHMKYHNYNQLFMIYVTQKFVRFGEKWQFVDFIYAWLYMGYGYLYCRYKLYLCDFSLIA